MATDNRNVFEVRLTNGWVSIHETQGYTVYHGDAYVVLQTFSALTEARAFAFLVIQHSGSLNWRPNARVYTDGN